MIFIGSRYQRSPVAFMLDGRTGSTRPTVLRSTGMTAAAQVTRWDYGARIDIYGSSLYNDPEQWWRVMDCNPEILDPASMQPGTPLRLP